MAFNRFRSSKQKNKILLLIILLAIVVYLSISQSSAQRENLKNRIDNRPVQKILFIGNSRTFVNNMPLIVQNMGNTLNAPFRYDVTMHALPGNTFEDHNTNPLVHDLLNKKWDYVIFQGGSPENTNPESREKFMKYGQALIGSAKKMQNQPILFTAWTYDENSYDSENEQYLKPYYLEYTAIYYKYINRHGTPPPDKPVPETFFPLDIKKHYNFIQHDYLMLSTQTNTPMVDVGQAFAQLPTFNRRFNKLTTDGNHPNLQGSYLAAAMFHRCFSKVSAQSISYTPSELSQDDADAIRTFIDQFYPNGTCPTIQYKKSL